MPKRFTPNDKWSQRAAKEGYRARSVYKLQEIDERFHLLQPGMTVLDLGAAPGSWLQYVSEKIGPRGKGIGFDLQPIEHIAENVHTYQTDITDFDAIQKVLSDEGIEKVDLLISDLAPKTSGIKDVDQWKSIELSHAVHAVAKRFLKTHGYCVMKVFRGADFDEFLKELKQEWQLVKTMQAAASRDRSFEIYVILQ